ncbi:MAG: DUF1684 domain-containing protein [Chitinophagaceae bacterium]|nr:DUF1684 domain-containing protein [Chitinophagaceae bacterium]
MTKSFFLILLLLTSFISSGQDTYIDSIRAYIDTYVEKHEVVTGDDKKRMQFFPVNETYRVTATFKREKNGKWFSMETSGTMKKVFRAYGSIHFTIHDTTLTLTIYQSQQLMTVEEYKDHLFLPFTDLTSGEESYASGRYIDLTFGDITGDKIVIDFNKAYNPYCAYVSGKYNCPIPPRENNLSIAILAGEKNYAKH